jgi:hypothetical protein
MKEIFLKSKSTPLNLVYTKSLFLENTVGTAGAKMFRNIISFNDPRVMKKRAGSLSKG